METPRFWGTEGSWSALLLTASRLILAQNSQWASWDRRGQRPGPHEPEPRSHGVLLRTRGRGAACLTGVPRRAPVAGPLARTAWHRRERGGGPARRQGPDGPHSRPRLPVGGGGPSPSLRTARHRQRPHVPAHRGRRVPLGLGAPEVSVEGAAVHFSSKDRLALNPQGARAAGQALSVRAMRLHTPQVRGQGSGVQAETRCACAGPGNAALCPVRPRRSPGRTAPLYCADVRAAQRSRGGGGRGGGECGSGAGFFEPKTRLGPDSACSGEGGSSRSAWRWAWKYYGRFLHFQPRFPALINLPCLP